MPEPKPKPINVKDRFEVCPECEYTGGFHLVIERLKKPKSPNAKLRLKCPSCRAVYDVGLVGTLAD